MDFHLQGVGDEGLTEYRYGCSIRFTF